jgi:hypothetical protein
MDLNGSHMAGSEWHAIHGGSHTVRECLGPFHSVVECDPYLSGPIVVALVVLGSLTAESGTSVHVPASSVNSSRYAKQEVHTYHCLPG